jgi:hypothetical protein
MITKFGMARYGEGSHAGGRVLGILRANRISITVTKAGFIVGGQ